MSLGKTVYGLRSRGRIRRRIHNPLVQRARTEPLQVDRNEPEANLFQFTVDRLANFQQSRNLARFDFEPRNLAMVPDARDPKAEPMQELLALLDPV